jgi:hypothetical protein
MGHGPSAFKEADLKRATKAILEAGLQIAGYRFYRDGFAVIIGKPSDGEALKVNVWDEVLEQNEPN